MLVNEDAKKLKRAWGVWITSPHSPLSLREMHDTRKAAVAKAEELLRKGWGDYLVVRRVDFGPPTIFEKSESDER